jgi:hypothetical protein
MSVVIMQGCVMLTTDLVRGRCRLACTTRAPYARAQVRSGSRRPTMCDWLNVRAVSVL